MQQRIRDRLGLSPVNCGNSVGDSFEINFGRSSTAVRKCISSNRKSDWFIGIQVPGWERQFHWMEIARRSWIYVQEMSRGGVDTRRMYCTFYEKSADIKIHYGRRRSSTLSSDSDKIQIRSAIVLKWNSLASLWNWLVTLCGDYQRHGLHSISMLAIGVTFVTFRWITFPWIFFWLNSRLVVSLPRDRGRQCFLQPPWEAMCMLFFLSRA